MNSGYENNFHRKVCLCGSVSLLENAQRIALNILLIVLNIELNIALNVILNSQISSTQLLTLAFKPFGSKTTSSKRCPLLTYRRHSLIVISFSLSLSFPCSPLLTNKDIPTESSSAMAVTRSALKANRATFN